MTARVLAAPHPGSVFGSYPERRDNTPHRPAAGRLGGRWHGLARYQRIAANAGKLAQRLTALPAHDLAQLGAQVGAQVARGGFDEKTVTRALAIVAQHARRALGVQFYPSQFICAAALLDQRLVEMATGEGKTLAAALAAAAAALAGIPVHLVTANDYLARRDAQHLAPLYESMAITVASALEPDDAATRQQAYRADVVYATARTIAFDYLRDRLERSPNGQAVDPRLLSATPQDQRAGVLLRGLCMAIVDEADSVLIDEAKMPLIISGQRPDAGERARLWQALDLARRLTVDTDYRVLQAERRAELTGAGRQAIQTLAAEYGSAWLNRKHREEQVEVALTALFALHRDIDYLVDSDEVQIIDAVTGRRAAGRVWSRGLHGAVAIKEGVDPPPATETRNRTTYPQLFARYHHLCGLSGSLVEVRREMRNAYGLSTVVVPLHRPCLRQVGATGIHADRDAQFAAALARVRELIAHGRPVLLTVDSVVDSHAMAQLLEQAGVPHAVLNAGNAEQEAAVVAQAGRQVRVTVATQMAGRGTDIELSDQVLAAGGLHVLNLQHNRSRRTDRQIAGRAGRQGQPGSCELSLRLDAPQYGGRLMWLARRLAPADGLAVPARTRALAGVAVAVAQRLAEWQDASTRHSSQRQDKDWSRRLHFAHNSD